MPITLLYGKDPFFSAWFNNIALFTLWPLLKKDGLIIQYIAGWILWNTLTQDVWKGDVGKIKKYLGLVISCLIKISFGIIAVLSVLEMTTPPPSSLPDLYVVLNSVFGCFCFGISYLYLNFKLWTLPHSSGGKVKKE
jgi:alpha-1,3-glucosyltransferase